MATYALIATRKQSVEQMDGSSVEYVKDQVINVVVWDGTSPYEVTPYQRLEEIQPGWGVVDGKLAPLPEAAPPPAPPAPKVYTRRRHVFERATQAECAAIAAAMAQAEDRLTQIFMASDWMDHASQWWPELDAAMGQAVGAERAAVLLAPSTYPET